MLPPGKTNSKSAGQDLVREFCGGAFRTHGLHLIPVTWLTLWSTGGRQFVAVDRREKPAYYIGHMTYQKGR